jgi:hypothetical protein
MLRKIAFAAAVVTAWPVAQAADAGSGQTRQAISSRG